MEKLSDGVPLAPKKFEIDLNKNAEIAKNLSNNVAIRSLDYKNNELLIGTRGSEVIICDMTSKEQDGQKFKQKVVQGHSPQQSKTYNEVWGLSTHPTDDLFASAGSDGTVKLWNKDGMMKSSEKFANDITAISWSSDGSFIACGDRAGYCFLIDAASMAKTSNGYASTNATKKSKAPWVEAMMVSPDDKFVAWGAHGGLAYVEIGKVQAMKVSKFKMINYGSTSITQMDWSEDGNYVAYNAGEPLAVNVSGGGKAFASECKDVQWKSWHQIFGWGVQGIWQGNIDYTDINCTARSHN
jgi:microtubule-associated protein-like 6